MKSLIIFASKYGGTRVTAEKLAGLIGNCGICELGKAPLPDLGQFDCIIVGSPLYAGSIHKEVSDFLKNYSNILMEKKLGIFLAGLDTSEGEGYFRKNVPESLLKHASAKEMIGGICNPKTLGFFTRILMRMITKSPDYSTTVSDEKMKKFADSLKAHA